jgi:hypothetical protein
MRTEGSGGLTARCGAAVLRGASTDEREVRLSGRASRSWLRRRVACLVAWLLAGEAAAGGPATGHVSVPEILDRRGGPCRSRTRTSEKEKVCPVQRRGADERGDIPDWRAA